MIQSIELTNFKCFEQQLVVVKPLTLLAGLNSSGKSTIHPGSSFAEAILS